MSEKSAGNSNSPPILDLIEIKPFRAGRKTKCTPEIIDLISRMIATGLSTRDACKIAQIDHGTFYNWQRRGRKEYERLEQMSYDWEESDILATEAIYMLFFHAIKKAIPIRKLTLIKKIRLADQWQSSAWLLERLHPDEFGKKTTIEMHTWQSEAIDLIRQNMITFEAVKNELGRTEAIRLFERAGAEIPEAVQSAESS